MIHEHAGEELLAYERLLPSWLPSKDGQYVVIRGNEVQRFFDTYDMALEWAYDTYGLEKFFVKRIAADQDVAHFTRELGS